MHRTELCRARRSAWQQFLYDSHRRVRACGTSLRRDATSWWRAMQEMLQQHLQLLRLLRRLKRSRPLLIVRQLQG